ncbi:FAD-dependent oxidoreductase, partial [Mesorhizobium sp. M7A.F.Ca.ET.027.03.2.1]|uniref:FAD-dependent oxidoreductase n=1 Tax=Mesorhizobium sp. M7A.F.Ca.ET.027.03.2.1 TaxID=2496656 RepID=UPI000FCAEE31
MRARGSGHLCPVHICSSLRTNRGGEALKSHYRAVVIGGGVVGASVLYHLTRFGWSDVALIER